MGDLALSFFHSAKKKRGLWRFIIAARIIAVVDMAPYRASRGMARFRRAHGIDAQRDEKIMVFSDE